MTALRSTPLMNPYTPGQTGPGKARRVAQVEAIHKSIIHTQSTACVLFGQRRIGKTSLLLQLRDSLPGMGAIRTVFFDLQDKIEDESSTILHALATEIIEQLQLEPARIKKPTTDAAFRGEFMPAVGRAIGGARLVILFDEFDVLTPKNTSQVGDLPDDTGDPLESPGDHRREQERSRRTRTFLASLERLMAECRWVFLVFSMGRHIEEDQRRPKHAQVHEDDFAARFFRNISRFHVPLLTEEETYSIIDLSTSDGTLLWKKEARRQIWLYTNGHPLYVQALCSQVWETMVLGKNWQSKVASIDDVHEAVDPVLKNWGHAVDWLWKSLNPACKVVTSALAQHGSPSISEKEMFDILRETGVSSVLDELRSAPELLIKWDLVTLTGNNYRFCVELIRRWVRSNYPLDQTQKLVDLVNPVAENLYQAAISMNRKGQRPRALEMVNAALAENPDHARALALAASIHVEEGRYVEAERLLVHLRELQENYGRDELLKALRVQADREQALHAKLALYDRILELHPTLQIVRDQRAETLRICGEDALQTGALAQAVAYFERAGLDTRVVQVRQQIRDDEVRQAHETVVELTDARNFTEALTRAELALQQYPELQDELIPLRDRLQQKLECRDLFARACSLRDQGHRDLAIEQFLEIARRDIQYPDVTRELDTLVRQSTPQIRASAVDPTRRTWLAAPAAAMLVGAGGTLLGAWLLLEPIPPLSLPLIAASAQLDVQRALLRSCAASAPATGETCVMPPTARTDPSAVPTGGGIGGPPEPAIVTKTGDVTASVKPPVKPPAKAEVEAPKPTVETPKPPVETPKVSVAPPESLTCAAMKTKTVSAIRRECADFISLYDFDMNPPVTLKCTYMKPSAEGAHLDKCTRASEVKNMIATCAEKIKWSKGHGSVSAFACGDHFQIEIEKPA